MKNKIPLIATLLVLVGLIATLRQKSPGDGFDKQGFAKLPVLLGGRTQPIDSVARNSLLILRGKQTVALPDGGSLTALDWFLEMSFAPKQADTRPVFRIDHPDVRGMLKLATEEKFFSYDQIKSNLGPVTNEARRIFEAEIKAEQQTPVEKAVNKLFQNIILYGRIKNTLKPEDSADFASELKAYQAVLVPGVKAVQKREAKEELSAQEQKDFDTILEYLQRYNRFAAMAYALMVPSGTPNHERDDWSNLGQALMESARAGQILAPVMAYANLGSAYQAGDVARFNAALTEYRQWLSDHHYAPEVSKGVREHYFNFLEPFYKASALYVLVFILAMISFFNQSPTISRTAFWLLGLTWVVHTTGLIYRMVLEGRPPVTNLYSSAVFIGWGVVLFGLVLEGFYKNAIGTVVSSVGGFTTLIIAHHLSLGGDTMEMMRAVLDTNFWLATHVVAVTMGYSATFMAGFLALLYVLAGVFSTALKPNMERGLTRMVYGIVCFATLFSFVGTVLGGIWADQSWGRFWGWDPKENGALMIVIWNAIYLHARWGKIFSEQTMMAIAIFGNVVTAFSWFGVNMLGIGLHAYGFMDAAFWWLLLFDVINLVILAFAFLPKSKWRSFAGRSDASNGYSGSPSSAPVGH